MTEYLIGIDGGGSHTEGVLCSTAGEVIATKTAGPSSTVGTELSEAMENLSQVVRELMGAMPPNTRIVCLYAGISGCGIKKDAERYRELLRERFPDISNMVIASDVFNPVFAAGLTENVIAAVCGTGSIAYAMTRDEVFRVDGYGYLLGDDAGGFAIGRQVLNSILRYADGRGEPTLLTALFEKREGATILERATPISEGGKMVIASFAPLAFEAARAGDKVATAILDRVVEELCAIISAAAKKIDVSPVPVVTGGSIWGADGARILKAVKERLGDGYVWLTPTLPVTLGAVIRAAGIAGIKDFQIKA